MLVGLLADKSECAPRQVRYDFPGELSILCGLLFVYGLNIEEGQIFISTSEEDYEWARRLRDILIEAGVEVEWTEVKSVGHQYLGGYQEQLMDWFKTHSKD